MSDIDTTEQLTGDALDARAAELEIEGRSSMSADEKRAAIAEAEAPGEPQDIETVEVAGRSVPVLDDLDQFSSHLARDTTHLQNVKPNAIEDRSIIGSRSSAARVTFVQAALNGIGYHVQVDGQYGRQTIAGVQRFQREHDLDETDEVDQATAAALANAVFEDS